MAEQAEITGAPLPPEVANEPGLEPGLELYLVAFWELDSCRTSGFAQGAIPWTAMDAYCWRYEISGDMRERLLLHVRSLDNAYLIYQAEQLKKRESARTK